MANASETTIECTMCGYRGWQSKDERFEHLHKHVRNFRVYCQEKGCGESFRNWDTLKKHHSRKHSVSEKLWIYVALRLRAVCYTHFITCKFLSRLSMSLLILLKKMLVKMLVKNLKAVKYQVQMLVNMCPA